MGKHNCRIEIIAFPFLVQLRLHPDEWYNKLFCLVIPCFTANHNLREKIVTRPIYSVLRIW